MRLLRHTFACIYSAAALVAADNPRSPLDTLRERSPFAPRENTQTQLASARADLEFRGVSESDGQTMVGIFDRTTGTSFWTSVGGANPEADAVVLGFDPTVNTLRLAYGGRTLTLALATATYDGPSLGSAEAADFSDITGELAASLAAAATELELDDFEANGRRLVALRLGMPSTPALGDHDGSTPIVSGRRTTSAPTPAQPPETLDTLSPDLGDTDIAAAIRLNDDNWLDEQDGIELVLADDDDGGRTRLIRRRIGRGSVLVRVD